MLVITVRHLVKPDHVDQAKARIAANTELMCRQDGFMFRHTGSPPDEPREVVTVTGWRSAAHRRAWDEQKGKVVYPPDQRDPYERVEQIEAEMFDVRWSSELHAVT